MMMVEGGNEGTPKSKSLKRIRSKPKGKPPKPREHEVKISTLTPEIQLLYFDMWKSGPMELQEREKTIVRSVFESRFPVLRKQAAAARSTSRSRKWSNVFFYVVAVAGILGLGFLVLQRYGVL
jgi:hypothetical protein